MAEGFLNRRRNWSLRCPDNGYPLIARLVRERVHLEVRALHASGPGYDVTVGLARAFHTGVC